MGNILTVVLKILPTVIIIFIGVWMKRRKFVSRDTAAGLTKIVMNFTLPALLFLSFFEAVIDPVTLSLVGVIFLVSLMTFASGFLVQKHLKQSNRFLPALFAAWLTGPIAFPLFSTYFGLDNLYKLVMLDIGNSVFIFSVLIAYLTTVSDQENAAKHKSIPFLLKNLIRSPLLIAMALGLLFSMTGWGSVLKEIPLGASILETLSLISAASFPLMLLIMGFELPFDFRNYRRILPLVLLRVSLMLVLAYLLNTFVLVPLFGLDEIYQAALYTMLIMPPPFIIPLSIIGESRDKDDILDIISLHVIVTLVVFVVLMAVL